MADLQLLPPANSTPGVIATTAFYNMTSDYPEPDVDGNEEMFDIDPETAHGGSGEGPRQTPLFTFLVEGVLLTLISVIG